MGHPPSRSPLSLSPSFAFLPVPPLRACLARRLLRSLPRPFSQHHHHHITIANQASVTCNHMLKVYQPPMSAHWPPPPQLDGRRGGQTRCKSSLRDWMEIPYFDRSYINTHSNLCHLPHLHIIVTGSIHNETSQILIYHTA